MPAPISSLRPKRRTRRCRDQSFSYDWQGEEGTFTDQNATVHTYSYDLLGRLTGDAVTLGSGSAVDNAVLMRAYSYETQGQLYQATTRATAPTGSIVNQIQFAYDGFGRVAVEYQEHSGAVNTGSSAKVQYNYSEMSGGVNNDRLTSMVYPNGRQLDYYYNSGIDDTVSRISGMKDDAGTYAGTSIESYKYLGLDTIVERDRQNSLNLTYISGSAGGDGGDQYQGLDRFGRVVSQNWVSGSTGKDQFQYGYDPNSNVLYKKNMLSASNSELYHDNAAAAGDSFTTSKGYDAFNRLTNFRRGTLSASASNYNYGNLDTVTNTNLATSTGSVKGWTLDAQGNWTSSAAGTGNGTNSPTAPTSTSRTNNRQNQVTVASGSTSPTYDNNGNMTTDQTGKSYTYDAWNDMVATSPASLTYSYDALGQSPASSYTPCGCCGAQTTQFYYSTGWQNLEEDLTVGGSTSIQNQNVWGLGYVDALVARDDNSSGGSIGKTSSGLGVRLFAEQDANFNVTSISNVSGAVQERFIFDPYGSFQVLSSTWTSTSDSYSWKFLFQDLAYDSTTGLYNGRNRMYSPTLGRWMQREPNGSNYIDGANLYQGMDSGPVDHSDPWGLESKLTISPEPVFQNGPSNPNDPAYSWQVLWGGLGDTDTGRIVQRIKVTATVHKCGQKDTDKDASDKLSHTFYEYWGVKNSKPGFTLPVKSKPGEPEKPPVWSTFFNSDTFAAVNSDFADGTWGSVTIEGAAKFVSGNFDNTLNDKSPHESKYSKDLPSYNNEPPWAKNGAAYSVKHTLVFSWNKCKCPPTQQVDSTDPKAPEKSSK